MMKLFYKIWVDVIVFEKVKPDNENSWKGFVMAYMAILVGLNIATVYTVLFMLGIDFMEPVMKWISLYIHIVPLKKLAWAFIMMFIPAFVINYFFVFYKKKYEKLIVQYENKEAKKGELFRKYFLVSFLLFLVIGFINNFR